MLHCVGWMQPPSIFAKLNDERQTRKKPPSSMDFCSLQSYVLPQFLNPKSEIVIYTAADIDVCEQLRSAYAFDIKKYFWDMLLISGYCQGAVSYLEQATRFCSEQSKLLWEVPPPPLLSWTVTHRQLGRCHSWMSHTSLWVVGTRGGTDTGPGAVDLIRSWREDIPIMGFSLVGQPQGCFSQTWDAQVFPSHYTCLSGEAQKPSHGWEVLKEKQLCPGKRHVRGYVSHNVVFWAGQAVDLTAPLGSLCPRWWNYWWEPMGLEHPLGGGPGSAL